MKEEEKGNEVEVWEGKSDWKEKSVKEVEKKWGSGVMKMGEGG